MKRTFDIAVIGAGIAGASVAAHLARAGKRVALFEMERQAGYHTTGRSAAVFAPSYGPTSIRALTRASEAFFRAPPEGFTEAPLFSPRKIMMIARSDQQEALSALIDDVDGPSITRLDETALRAFNPLVREGYAHSAMLDEAGQDIDVNALHQGFLRMLKAAGGEIILGTEIIELSQDKRWQIETSLDAFEAEIVVNAAGAWADEIAQMAGAEKIGLTPKRRTALMIPQPAGSEIDNAPITIDIGEQFYMKPDAGRLLISPADETPSPACDAQPEEIDIAICVDRIETAFDVQVRKIETKWAGLRSFVPDGSPVVGYSGRAKNFFWLAGQGGYGIQTAPALAEFAAGQVLEQAAPEHVLKEGLIPEDIAPTRF